MDDCSALRGQVRSRLPDYRNVDRQRRRLDDDHLFARSLGALHRSGHLFFQFVLLLGSDFREKIKRCIRRFSAARSVGFVSVVFTVLEWNCLYHLGLSYECGDPFGSFSAGSKCRTLWRSWAG